MPASSANLGPGFDVLAAALALHVEVRVAETGRFAVHTDLAIARDRRNLCVRAFATRADPGRCEFTIASNVPLSGGLGTSAAAVVAGLMAARALAGARDEPPEALLPEAAALEGHPDNAAAALLGGFVACAEGRTLALGVPGWLAGILVVPDRAVRTARARAALPATVPHADAAFNVGSTALLVGGLLREDRDALAAGLADRLHQPYRASLYPRSAALVESARSLGALGATISGAGPSVLVWVEAARADAVATRLEEAVAGWARVLRAPFEPRGAAVL